MSDLAQYGCLLVNRMIGRKHAPKCVSKVLKKVERKKNKLISNRDFVEQKLGAINPDTDDINGNAVDWLEEANILLQEMENLRIRGKVPPWKEFKKLQKRIKVHNKKCKFDPISTPILTLQRFSCLRNNFMPFKSIEKASDKLFAALRNDDCSVIGLYGKQGSGKTLVVTAMKNKVEFLNIFDKVLLVNVTRNPNIKTIQDEIADLLNIVFNKYAEFGRAEMISTTIKNLDSPILVIFDDVQKELDLQGIGIPCDSKLCKVILTTHHQGQRDFIDCQNKIQIDPLSRDESWTLFEKYSSIHHNSTSSELLNIAHGVVSECEDLPGKIIKIGSCLKDKPIEEWKKSLDKLRLSKAKCQIFLSFRGSDTRDSFTGFLYYTLVREGFNVFMDDAGMERGDEISSSLINAIEASRISIVVLSENFAYSNWCLDELVKILECKEKMKTRKIWPIFYKVEVSDVRRQKNSYEHAMAFQEKKFRNDPEKVKKWRSALFEVSNLRGILTYKTGYEYKTIEEIVKMANDHRNLAQDGTICS